MIAARLCGIVEFSLAALIKRYFDVERSKGSQKANWARRPLPPQMAEYAVKDTHYLLEIASILEGRTSAAWAASNGSANAAQKAVAAPPSPRSATRTRSGASPAARICADAPPPSCAPSGIGARPRLRPSTAPPFTSCTANSLSKAPPGSIRDHDVNFSHLHGARRRRFFEAVEKAKALPESEWPKIIRKPRPRPTRGEEERFKAQDEARHRGHRTSDRPLPHRPQERSRKPRRQRRRSRRPHAPMATRHAGGVGATEHAKHVPKMVRSLSSIAASFVAAAALSAAHSMSWIFRARR